MVWAGPFDLGLYAALNNWFVSRRTIATSIATVAQMSGLVALPMIAQFAMHDGGWRSGWIAVGATVLVVGFLPVWLFLVRRPEDLGLVPDQAKPGAKAAAPEPRFSRAEAMRTRAFWLLSLYTVLVFPVQAGVSLHQAAHLIERGLTPIAAATVISVFSAMTAVASFGVGFLPRRLPLRYTMSVAAVLLTIGTLRPDRRDQRARGLSGGRPLRARDRRHHDPAAGGLGRLFRPRELRRDPRRGAVACRRWRRRPARCCPVCCATGAATTRCR